MGLFKVPPGAPPAPDTGHIKAGWGDAGPTAAPAAAPADASSSSTAPPTLHRTLTALTAEYDRLKRQQRLLEAAVAEHAAIVARPRAPPADLVGALAPGAQPAVARKKKKAPGVSGGMTALPVAEDLLALDFTAPADAPPEFRAAPFDAAAAAAAATPLHVPLPSPGDVIAPDDVGDLLGVVLAQQKLILRLLADKEGGGHGLAKGAVERLKADGVL